MNPQIVRTAWCASAARCAIQRVCERDGVWACAVGGGVRDALLGRVPHDWDVVCHDALRLARAVAKELGGSFVWLHDNPVTCRVVIGAHDAAGEREELDFCDLRGASLPADLQARDFAINSVAWRIGAAEGELCDPCGGLADLAAGVVRANSAAVLADDALRCLRAFRLAGELGFSIAPQTRGWIAEQASGLEQTAGERVGAELLRLLETPGVVSRLEQMDGVGVLGAVLPELQGLKGLAQGRYHHLDGWGHTLLVVAEVEGIAAAPEHVFPASAGLVGRYLAEPGRIGRLKFAALLHDIGKPGTQARVDGAIRFIGHEVVGAELARRIAARMHLAGSVRHALISLTHWHMRPVMLADLAQEPTVSAIRRLMRDCDPDGPGAIALAAADMLACLGPATDAADQRARIGVLDRMVTRYEEWLQAADTRPLLRGRDLIEELGLEPGPVFSRILDAVEQAQADGELSSREQALALARRIGAEEGSGEEHTQP